jgi:hypothetical protein
MRTLPSATYWWRLRPTDGRVQDSIFNVQTRIATQNRKRQRVLTATSKTLFEWDNLRSVNRCTGESDWLADAHVRRQAFGLPFCANECDYRADTFSELKQHILRHRKAIKRYQKALGTFWGRLSSIRSRTGNGQLLGQLSTSDHAMRCLKYIRLIAMKQSDIGLMMRKKKIKQKQE